jgi:hypothetical protein
MVQRAAADRTCGQYQYTGEKRLTGTSNDLAVRAPVETTIAAAGAKMDRLSNPAVGYATNTHE